MHMTNSNIPRKENHEISKAKVEAYMKLLTEERKIGEVEKRKKNKRRDIQIYLKNQEA